MSPTSEFDNVVNGVGVVRSGGHAIVPQDWKEPPFTCWATGPTGWFNLDDHDRYYVGSDSFQSATMTWRRQTVQGPYVAGRYVTHAVPDTVTENLTIRVMGESQLQLQKNLADLIDTFSQISYNIVWSVDLMSYTWHCEMADYSIAYTNAELFARNVPVKFNVPRLPMIEMGSLA